MDIYERRKMNIKKLQEWYSRKYGGDTISDATALEILRATETWGHRIFDAAYDILMGDEPQ